MTEEQKLLIGLDELRITMLNEGSPTGAKICKNAYDYISNRLDGVVSSAEPNQQVCANCKWLVDRGEDNMNVSNFCNNYDSETCDILIIKSKTFGCNQWHKLP